MEKKTSKRQTAAVSLSDYNQKQIDDLQQEQRNMTEQFEQRKQGVYRAVITFHVSRRRHEMYCGHMRLCVCVCVSVCSCMPTLLHGSGCNLGEW